MTAPRLSWVLVVTICGFLPSRGFAFDFEPHEFQTAPNGHTYGTVRVTSTSVGETFSFALAKAQAHSMRHNGMVGHLATITSDQEMQYLKDLPSNVEINGMTAALAAPNGSFYWEDGPEARDFVSVPGNVSRLPCCCPDDVNRYMQVDRDRWYTSYPNQSWLGPYSDSWSTVPCGGGEMRLIVEFSPTWTVPTPHLDYPPAGTQLGQGDSVLVGWSTLGGCGPIVCGTLSVSRSGAEGPFDPVADELPGSGEFMWVADGQASSDVYFKIQVCDSPGLTAEAVSEQPISVLSVPGGTRSSRPVLNDPLPQPATGRTVLRYEIPREGIMQLSIVDVQGRTLRNLYSGLQSAGSHSARFDAKQLPASVLFAQLKFEGRCVTRKIVVVR